MVDWQLLEKPTSWHWVLDGGWSCIWSFPSGQLPLPFAQVLPSKHAMPALVFQHVKEFFPPRIEDPNVWKHWNLNCSVGSTMFCHLWIVCSDGLRYHSTGITRIGWFLSTFTEGMHFALSEWYPWLAPMGDYVPCVCVIWMHWAKSSWCSQVGPIMFCQCRCIILWKVLITVHWVVRLFNWFIEPQQAWAVLVDSYLPLLRECILFHQNGIQRSHKWGTRLPCPILVYWLKVLRYLCSVGSTRLPVSYMCVGWRSWVLGSVGSTEVASWRDWVYFVLSGANLRSASESINPKWNCGITVPCI